jgi:hypothetical protein
MGTYPSFITVAFEPGSLTNLEQFVSDNSLDWDDNDDKSLDNVRTISVDPGRSCCA